MRLTLLALSALVVAPLTGPVQPAYADGGVGGGAAASGGTDSATGPGGAGGDSNFGVGLGGGGGAGATGGRGGGFVGGPFAAGGGAPGASGQDGGFLGGGGGGAHGFVGAVLPVSPVTGGAGGAGGNNIVGGGGGAGGYGAVITAGGALGTASSTISGGRGGRGGDDGDGGNGGGGSGGIGLLLFAPSSLTILSSVTGGNGGAAGAQMGNSQFLPNPPGAGGAGIVGSDLSIISGGTVTGGVAGDGVTRANAFTFTGGANTLTFTTANAGLTGNIGLPNAGTTLTLAQPTDVTLGSAITGAGSVTKTGAGTLSLTGVSTYTGPTAVNGGNFQVLGSVTNSNITVGNGGTLSGTGKIGDPAILAGGTLSPGSAANPTGTLTIVGPLSFAAGSFYTVSITPTANSRTNVVGATTIGGGTVNVLAGAGTYATTRYTILNATGGVTGSFTSLNASTNLAFLNPTLSYDANNVYLSLTATNPTAAGTPDYRPAALTRNQNAVATALTLNGAASPAFANGALLTALNNTTLPGARQAFDALSGEVHAGVARTLLFESDILRSSILGRLRSGLPGYAVPGQTLGALPGTYEAGYAAAGPRRERSVVPVGPTLDPTVVSLWGEGVGSFGSADRARQIGAATLERTTGGFVAGIDATIAGAGRLGVAGGFTESHLDLNARSSRAEITSGFGALYGATSFYGLVFRGGLAGAGHDIDTRRAIAFPGFADTAHAKYGGTTGQVFGEAGLPIAIAGGPSWFSPGAWIGERILGAPARGASVTLEPFVGLAGIRVGTDRFTEIGGAAALSGFSRERDLGTVTAGLRTETVLGPSGEFVLRNSIGYRGAYGEVDPYARLAFASGLTSGTGVAYSILSVPLDRHALVTETRLDWKVTPQTTLGLTYAGSYGRNADDSQVAGRMEYRW